MGIIQRLFSTEYDEYDDYYEDDYDSSYEGNAVRKNVRDSYRDYPPDYIESKVDIGLQRDEDHYAGRVSPVRIKSEKEASLVVDRLLDNIIVVLNFQETEDSVIRNCLNYFQGAAYVMGATLKDVGNRLYIMAPSNVEVLIED